MAHCPLPAAHYCFKSFTCNTYGPPRKCCKQKTYGLVKPFRCTYKKTGGAGPAFPILELILLPILLSPCPTTPLRSKSLLFLVIRPPPRSTLFPYTTRPLR